MSPLNAPVSLSGITLFVEAMLPHPPFVFNDALLWMPTFLIRVLMDTLALYEICLLSDAVRNYFGISEMDDENAKYLFWFASFFDPFRDFIPAIFKRYHLLLTGFCWKDIENGQKSVLEETDDIENKTVLEARRQNMENVAQSHASTSVVTERPASVSPVSVPLPQSVPMNSQVSVGIQYSTLQEHQFESSRGQSGPSSLPKYVPSAVILVAIIWRRFVDEAYRCPKLF